MNRTRKILRRTFGKKQRRKTQKGGISLDGLPESLHRLKLVNLGSLQRRK